MKPMGILLTAVLGALCVGGTYAQERPSTKTVKAVRGCQGEALDECHCDRGR